MWRVLLVVALPACVSYRAQDITLKSVDREVAARKGARLDFAGAVRVARSQNADLRRLAAEARAAGLDIPAVFAGVAGNTRTEVAGGRVDLLQLLRIGPRGAAAKAAHARQVEALAALRTAEQHVAARIAEAFLIERVLSGRTVPTVRLDAARFHEAGLASDADRKRVEFALAAEQAERITIDAERAANLARLRRLLGLAPGTRVVPVLPGDDGFPDVAGASRARVLTRPDLARALAAYYTADAEFRLAVAEQYPTLEIGGEIEWDGSGSGGLVAIRIPLGASEPARAAGERREAARMAVEAALLQAYAEVDVRAAGLLAADARADAFAKRASAARSLHESALARLDVEPDAFTIAAEMASLLVRTAIAARETAVAAARARVALAEAYGWPAGEEVG